MVTGGKQDIMSVQPERLSGGNYIVYWVKQISHYDKITEGYVGITKNFNERMKSHKKNKSITHFTSAIRKYGWNNLIKSVIYKDLTLQEALEIEYKLRSKQNIGWNSQKGGELGVEAEWYTIYENKVKHSLNTSKATKVGIAVKDSKENRSTRAKQNREINSNSYKNVNKGENNSHALLKEVDVINIKFTLILEDKSNSEIAKLYGVKNYVIRFIRNNKTWKHIVCDSPAHE